MKNVGDVVSNDICGSGNVCNLKAYPVAQEEGAVLPRASPPRESLHPFGDHASLVVLSDSIQTIR